MVKHHYALVAMLLVMLFACSKDTSPLSINHAIEIDDQKSKDQRKVPYAYPIHCSSTKQSTTGPRFRYSSYPISGHFDWNETISYKVYETWDNVRFILVASRTIRAADFAVFLSDSHYYIEIQANDRALEIYAENHLPYPYQLLTRSRCLKTEPDSGNHDPRFKQY